jgi:hypothetical protein
MRTPPAVSAAPAEFYVRSLLWIACYILTVTMIYALHERMRANAPRLTRAMLIAGSAAVAMAIAESIINLQSVGMIVPTQDLSAFRACWAVTEGLHWAGGHLCGWAFLFLGCAALKTRTFSRILGGLVLLTGVLWIPNIFFVQIGFMLLTPIYLLSCCVSVIWISVVLLRQKQPQPELKEMAASR